MPATVRPAADALAEEHEVLVLNFGRFTRSAFHPVPFCSISKWYRSEEKSIRPDQKLVRPKFFNTIYKAING